MAPHCSGQRVSYAALGPQRPPSIIPGTVIDTMDHYRASQGGPVQEGETRAGECGQSQAKDCAISYRGQREWSWWIAGLSCHMSQPIFLLQPKPSTYQVNLEMSEHRVSQDGVTSQSL